MKRYEVQKRLTGSRLALLISLGLHLIIFIAFRSTGVHNYSYSLPGALSISLINILNDETTPKPDMPFQHDSQKEKEIRERLNIAAERLPKELSGIAPRRSFQQALPARRIISKIESDVIPDKTIPAINADFSNNRPLSNFTLSSPGPVSDSQGDGTGKRPGGSEGSGTGRFSSDSGKLPGTHREIPRRNSSTDDNPYAYKETDIPFIKALQEFTRQITDTKPTGKVDITFLVDISESMEDDIEAIRRHLNRMSDKLNETRIDFTLGIVTFHHNLLFEWMGTDIEIYPQTSNVDEIKKILKGIKVSGGERPLDAIMRAIEKVRFRQGAARRFILITDEYVKGTYTVSDVLREAKRAGITIDVLGKDEPFQRAIAEQTGGTWMPIEKVEE